MFWRTGNSEYELVKRARRQDSAAIKSLYDKYVQYLAAVCGSYISSEDDVKDVLQDGFLKIFSSLDKFEWRGEGSLKLWMRRVVVNEALMFIRSQMKRLCSSAVIRIFRKTCCSRGWIFPQKKNRR